MTKSSGYALAALALALATTPGAALAQEPDRINIYRYILDIDVPEPAALVALERAPAHVLRASAPKPLAASVAFAHDSGGATTTVAALDVSPYFLIGGGIRSLASYRSMTAWGRIRRVITKTTLSLSRRRLGSRRPRRAAGRPRPPSHLPRPARSDSPARRIGGAGGGEAGGAGGGARR